MTTIGEYIKQARKVRKKTIKDLSSDTKIKQSFIKAIEKEQWNKLPEYPSVSGFVKSIAGALEINQDNLVKILKRDYPPQKLQINPKPEPRPEFRWSPKLTFLAGIAIVLVGIVGYLIYQYAGFLKPPTLEIIRPEDNQIIRQEVLEVSGITDPEASVTVNTQPAFVDEEGRFYTELEITPEISVIDVLAKSRSGKETLKQVNIQVEIE